MPVTNRLRETQHLLVTEDLAEDGLLALDSECSHKHDKRIEPFPLSKKDIDDKQTRVCAINTHMLWLLCLKKTGLRLPMKTEDQIRC